MPKVRLAPWLEEAYGSYGKETTFRRTPKGETSIIKKADMSKVKWSPAQIAQRQRMKEAIAYAQAILADPERKKIYAKRAKRKKRRAYDEALAEYLNAAKNEARRATRRQELAKRMADAGFPLD
ncbi:MAG: hypothetical protein ACM3XO_02920 [Bacteroidota bacterium]